MPLKAPYQIIDGVISSEGTLALQNEDRDDVAYLSRPAEGVDPERYQDVVDFIAAGPDLFRAALAAREVLAVMYQTRLRDGGAGQQAFEMLDAAIRKAVRRASS